MTEKIKGIKIWVHAIMSTQNKLPIILPDIESKVHKILAEELKNTGCFSEIINGTSDHVHIVFQLNELLSLNEIMKQLQVGSSLVINQECFQAASFGWNEDYLAFGISESQLSKVVEYVKTQKDQHKSKPFIKEVNEFLKLHGLIP